MLLLRSIFGDWFQRAVSQHSFGTSSLSKLTLLQCVHASRTDIVGKDGFSPMHWAAKENHLGIPTLLEEYGAEIVSGVSFSSLNSPFWTTLS